jgi:hypothetical protein
LTEGKVAIGALILLATWLVVGLPWLLYPSDRIEYRDSSQFAAQSSQAQPNGSANAPFFVQVVPTSKSAEERTQEAEDREEKKSADRWLVRWTFALFAATLGLILATGVLGYFAYQQARDMKASVAAAEDAAKAAKASAEALPVIEGGYVYPVIAKDNIEESLSAFQHSDVRTNRLRINFYFKNFGRTPANVLMYRAQLVMVNPDGPNLRAANTDTFRIVQKTTLGAVDHTEPLETEIPDFSSDEWGSVVQSATTRLYFTGEVRYADIWGTKWQFSFDWEYSPAHGRLIPDNQARRKIE